ncbi:hypothetical protein RB653_010645 [Dictyostelium firmibasis]|uniref:Importin subunit alpha n=1 Tax=Dictyostelium firmibasis TaxID=79012 RepID=A0AAN7TZQ0_9MYCE
MSSRDKQDSRKKEFKKSLDSETARRKREENSIGIRKTAREELMSKRRGVVQPSAAPSPSYQINVPRNVFDQFQKYENETMENKIINLPGLVTALNSNDQAYVYSSLIQFRKLLSIHANPPIDQVIECGVIPKFNQLLQCNNPKVQFESAWALTNIASGNNKQTQTVIESGSVPIFIHLLCTDTTDEVKEQCAWALGNIAGDTVDSRNYLLKSGAMNALIPLLQYNESNGANASNSERRISLIQNIAWTVSNLCRGKPQPDFSIVSQCLPAIKELINVDNLPSEIYGDLCWALSYLCDGPNTKIQTVIDSGVVPRLVKLLEYPESIVFTPALRAVGNIVTGESTQTQIVIDNNGVELITRLLSVQKKSIRKESCWALSNITAGEPSQIDVVVSNPKTVTTLISLLSHSEHDIKREACWALTNSTNNSSSKSIQTLVRHNILKHFIDLLNSQDLIILKIVLEGLINIVREGDKIKTKTGVNPYVNLITELDGESIICDLQEHLSKDVYKKANELIQFFEHSDFSDSENSEPNINQNGQYEFSSNYNSNSINI